MQKLQFSTIVAFIVSCVMLCVLIPGVCRAADRNAPARRLHDGRIALSRKEWSEAVNCFLDALTWDRRSADARAGLGTAYLNLGQPERARDEFVAALRQNPHNAEAERGVHQVRTTDEEEKAFVELEQLVKRQPQNAEIEVTYAEELIERNRYAEAQKAAEAALAIKRNVGHVQCALGRIALYDGKADAARVYLLAAIKSDRNDDDAYGALGELAIRDKDRQGAISWFGKASHIVPDERHWHEKLRQAYMAAGDNQHAEQEAATINMLRNEADKQRQGK